MQFVYFVVKTPIGISNRDFLHCKKIKKDYPSKGITALHYKSKEHPLCPPKPKIVRAYSGVCGYLIEYVTDPVSGKSGTKLSLVS